VNRSRLWPAASHDEFEDILLKLRVITALILAPLTLLGIFLLPAFGLSLALSCVFLIASHEWSGFISQNNAARLGYTLALGAVLFLTQTQFPMDAIDQVPLALWLFGAAGLWWVVALGLVLSYPKLPQKLYGCAWIKLLLGVVTLIPFFWALMTLRGLWPENITTGAGWVIYVLALVWAADSGAYFAGKRFGRHKLAPKVSPGKTIEGLLGGILASTIVIVAVVVGAELTTQQALWLLVASYLTVFASALGDLLESLLKREAGIKDSGRLLPGHGGVLDRIDSLTAALPIFTLCYLLWLA
jgi:phosphatidate cytidylyltransferase